MSNSKAATEQVEELKMRLALAAADSMGGAAFAALAVDELEQAIAATLGSESIDYMLNTIGRLEEENERLRSSCGTLTAEQVKRIYEIIEKHWHDLPAEYDMPEATALPEYSYNWQAIADELNAELGSGTCEWVLEHSGTLYDKWRCSKCGYLYVESRTDGGATDLDPKFCPCCGRKVVSA